jgi:coproporphyrinogen III oxidase
MAPAWAGADPTMTSSDERARRASGFFQSLQDKLCAELEWVDGPGRFRTDSWQRAGGGGGRSRVLVEGGVFEKAGVNFSEVHGELSEDFAPTLPGQGRSFYATGISLVLHPRSPMVPTVHANFRFLRHGDRQWYGGGSDLTPFYPYAADAVHFHRTWKAVCERYAGVVDYDRLKRWCDEYFYLPHRGEHRGVGGIFFDYLEEPADPLFDFVRDCGTQFVDAYLPIVERRQREPYSEEQRVFQEYRRGRYAEFNLLYDRGTLFGLKTGGRTESILMSLPPVVRWQYDYQAAAGSREAELLDFLRPRDWANEDPGA